MPSCPESLQLRICVLSDLTVVYTVYQKCENNMISCLFKNDAFDDDD